MHTVPTQLSSANPLFAGVHPNLIAELHGLDGRLNARMQHAYYVDHDEFAGSLLESQGRLRRTAGPQAQHQYQSIQEQPMSQPQPHVQTQVQHPPPLPHTQRPTAYSAHHRFSDAPNVTAPPVSYPNVSLTAANGTHCPTEAVSVMGYEHNQASQGLAYAQQTWRELAPTYDRYVPVPDPHAQATDQPWLNHPQHYINLQVQSQPPPPSPTQQPPQQINYASQEYVYPTSVPQTQTYPTMRPRALYTPEAAMHGYEADDHSLQEHWKSFMYNVGSPRQLMAD
jgi:hypothetical protein